MVFVFRLCTLNISWDCPPKTSTLNYSLLFQELPNGIGPAHNGPPMPHPHPPHIPHTSTSGPLPPMMGSNGPLPPMNGMMGPLPPMSVAGPMGPGPNNGGPLPPMSSGSLPPMVSWIKLPEKNLRILPSYKFFDGRWCVCQYEVRGEKLGRFSNFFDCLTFFG